MRDDGLTDLEKQELLQVLFLNKIQGPDAERLIIRLAESIGGDRQKKVVIAMTARYLASLGKREEAEALIHSHLDGPAQATALATIGIELAKFSSFDAAACLQRASKIISTVEDSDDRVSLLQRLVDGYLDLNQLTTAWNTASQIPLPSEQIHTLSKIAKRMWDHGDRENAERILLEVRNSISGTAPSDRANTLDDIAQLLAHMGQVREALDTWNEALKFVGESLDPPKLLFIICKGLVSINQRGRAREIAMSIENEARKAQVLAFIEGH